ncbi:hypothetical protein ACRRTK_003258 [Alexandromys fortis]
MQRDEEVLIRVQHEANCGKLQKNAKREILQGRPTSSVTLLASEELESCTWMLVEGKEINPLSSMVTFHLKPRDWAIVSDTYNEQLGLVGRDAPPADGRWLLGRLGVRGCRLGLSAAPWLPAPPRRRAAPRHLRGSAARALPAGSMELPDLRVRPQRRPENGRRLLGPSAPFHPGAGRRAARPRADAQASGRLRGQPPGATATEPAGTGLRGHRAGPGHRAQASRTQVLCSLSRTKILRNKVSPVLSHDRQGRPRLFPNMV